MRYLRLLALAVLLAGSLPLMAADLDISDEGDFVVIEQSTGLKVGAVVVVRKEVILSTEVHDVDGIAEIFITTSELVPHEGAAVHRVHRFRLGDFKRAAEHVMRIARYASRVD